MEQKTQLKFFKISLRDAFNLISEGVVDYEKKNYINQPLPKDATPELKAHIKATLPKDYGFKDPSQFEGEGIKIELFQKQLLPDLQAYRGDEIHAFAQARAIFFGSIIIKWCQTATFLTYQGSTTDQRFKPQSPAEVYYPHIPIGPKFSTYETLKFNADEAPIKWNVSNVPAFFLVIKPEDAENFIQNFKKCQQAYNLYTAKNVEHINEEGWDDFFQQDYDPNLSMEELAKKFAPQLVQESLKSENNQSSDSNSNSNTNTYSPRMQFSINSDKNDVETTVQLSNQ